MWLDRSRLLIAALWVGSLWTVGYLVAPTLFATLSDRMLAGSIAGSMFRSESWLSVACSLLLLILLKIPGNQAPFASRIEMRLILAMLACTLIGYFGLQPFMAALRTMARPDGVMEPAVKMQFGILHGASTIIYVIETLLGAILVWRLRKD